MRSASLSVAVCLAAASVSAGEARRFGKPLEGLPVTPLAQVLAHPEAGKRVRLEGSVSAVCQNKGCWLVLEQGPSKVHVTFEGYSFFVPKDSAGNTVVLEGTVRVQEPKRDAVEAASAVGRHEHLQSEGAGEAAAARVSIEATGVELGAAARPPTPGATEGR